MVNSSTKSVSKKEQSTKRTKDTKQSKSSVKAGKTVNRSNHDQRLIDLLLTLKPDPPDQDTAWNKRRNNLLLLKNGQGPYSTLHELLKDQWMELRKEIKKHCSKGLNDECSRLEKSKKKK